MNRMLVLLALTSALGLGIAWSIPVLAAGSASSAPSIVITGPRHGAAVHNLATATPKPIAGTLHLVTGGAPRGVGSTPVSTGGSGTTSTPLNVNLLLAGLLAVLLGLAFLGRRHAFAVAGSGASLPPADDPTVREAASESQSRNDQSGTPAPSQPAESWPPPPVEPWPGPVGKPPPSQEIPAVLPQPRQEPPAPARPQPVSPLPPDPLPRDAARVAPPPPTPPREPAQSSAPAPGSPDVAPAPFTGVTGDRARAVEMARQWSSVVEDLVREIDAQEAERRRLLARVATLEQTIREQDALRQALADSSGETVSDEDLQAVQSMTDSLVRDPDHILLLASVAQNADKFARVVSRYARIHRVLGGR